LIPSTAKQGSSEGREGSPEMHKRKPSDEYFFKQPERKWIDDFQQEI
jgi:hypothetical protein